MQQHRKKRASSTTRRSAIFIETALHANNRRTTTQPSESPQCCCKCKALGPKPPAVPPQGWTWSPVWTLQQDGNKSFEEFVLYKIKGPQLKKTNKRKKIDVTTKVITEEAYVEKLRELENTP